MSETKSENDFKWAETLFLGCIAGFGIIAGFSQGISLAKKQDEKSFNKVCFWVIVE